MEDEMGSAVMINVQNCIRKTWREETTWENVGVDGIILCEHIDLWRALVNTAVNLRVP
jgi:hypothetical protein